MLHADRIDVRGRRDARWFTRLIVALVVAVLLLGACARAADESSEEGSSSSNAEGTEQVVKPAGSSGPECTTEDYGAQEIDFEGAKVGFSQSEKEANPFRIAETQSIEDEASARGLDLVTTNANSQLSKQISDIQDMLAQGVEFLVVAPLNSDGLEPAFQAAKDEGVPIITIDRKVNMEPCQDYATFIGSDFYEQGRQAAEQMEEALGGEGKVAILLGAPGNNVTTDRTNGFVEYMEENAPAIEITVQQTGNFVREEGQQVMEQIIQADPDITGVYAENDEMALGALTALKAAGKQPGEDVHIVSIDGTREAVEAVVAGEFYAVVESNPRFGPLAFQAAEQYLGGEGVDANLIIEDKLYTQENAESLLSTAY